MSYFLDTNIIIYSIGKPHPLKAKCIEILASIERGDIEASISTEIVQEVLYVFSKRGKVKQGIEIISQITHLVQDIFPVDYHTILTAITFLKRQSNLLPRDAIHAAVMQNNGISEILTADADFDQFNDIRRIDPLRFSASRQNAL